MKKSNSIDHLKNKETWSIEEVLELFFCPSNPSAIIRGEIHQPIGELLEAAANQGRFGMLTTGPDKFYWDMELLQDSQYPDEPLDTITEFTAHYLKFIDWVNDDNVLNKIELDNDRREKVSVFIEKLNGERPEVKPTTHIIDNQRLIEEDFWTLTDLRIVLFGETYSSRYAPDFYHKYNSNLEALMRRIDQVVQDAALARRYLEVHEIQNRSPLIDSARENEIEQLLEDFRYFGIYDTDENGCRSQRYYHRPDLFNVLTLKGFPIPKGLVVSLDQNQMEPTLELFKKLRKNILYVAAHDKNPPNVQIDQADQKTKIGFKCDIEQDVFEREGDFWIVSIKGEKASGLKHLKGMSYISYLYKKENQEFHVVDLDQLVSSTSSFLGTGKYMETTKKIRGKHVQVNVLAEETKGKGSQSIYDISKINTPVDKKTIAILIKKKTDLEIELDKVMLSGDTEDEKRIQGEIEQLKKALNIISFSGRGKRDSPEIEKTRQRVQRCIADAIANIKKNNEHLGNYLKRHIKTGEFCRYLS
jgi:hypothetical protein